MQKKYFYLLSFFSLLALLPYLGLSLYAYPAADDYCAAKEALLSSSLLDRLNYYYFNTGGRYSSNFFISFSYIAIQDLSIYKIIPIVFIGIIILTFYLTLAELLYPIAISKILILFLSVLFSLIYLNQIPHLAEGVYWYIGSVTYLLGNVFCLLQLVLLAHFFRKGKVSYPLVYHLFSTILLFISIGFNEIGMMSMMLIYITITLCLWFKKDKTSYVILMYLIVALISGLIFYLAPGNFTRMSMYKNTQLFFNSFLWSGIQLFRFVTEWLSSFPMLIFSLLLAAHSKVLAENKMFTINYRILIFIMTSILFASFFLPYWSTGILGQHRTANFAYFFFIILWFMMIISISIKFKWHERLNLFQSPKMSFICLSLSLIFLAITKNGYDICYDYLTEKLDAFREEQINRTEMINKKVKAQEPCEIPLLKNKPKSIFVLDIKGTKQDWIEDCTCDYFSTIASQ